MAPARNAHPNALDFGQNPDENKIGTPQDLPGLAEARFLGCPLAGFLAFRIARKADFGMIHESLLLPVDDRDRFPAMAENRLRASKKDVADENDKGGSSLNFKVTPEFKKEFKGYAVSQGITMVDLLKEGFALSKKRRGR